MITIAEWVAALRSGKYQQTQGTLTDGVGFCCLGVACDVLNSDGWQREENVIFYSYSGYEAAQSLPPSVREQLEISIDLELHLIKMNDNGKTFSEIADYIEENI